MATTAALNSNQSERQFDAAYSNRNLVIMLCMVGSAAISASDPISKWENYEVQATGYGRQSAIVLKDPSSVLDGDCSSELISASFFASTREFLYDTVVAFFDGENYPAVVDSIGSTNVIRVGQKEAVTLRIKIAALVETETLASDPDYDKVVVLFHFEGEDDSLEIEDNSPNEWQAINILPYAEGKFAISKNQSRFGTSSLYNGSRSDDSFVELSMGNALDFGSQEFTVEFWVFLTQFANGGDENMFFGMYDDQNDVYSLGIGATETGQVFGKIRLGSAGEDSVDIATQSAITLARWHHIAFYKKYTTYYIALDGQGTSGLSSGSSDTMFFVPNLPARIGQPSTSSLDFDGFVGYIDEFRITKGVSRYSGSVFSVPTTAFPNF